MFKRYRFSWFGGGQIHAVWVYFYSKMVRKSLWHRAAIVGELPRRDGTKNDHDRYEANSAKLDSLRMFRSVPSRYRVFDKWEGQRCLFRMWQRLERLSFLKMRMISETSPFGSDEEPKCEILVEPDDIFGKGGRNKNV